MACIIFGENRNSGWTASFPILDPIIEFFHHLPRIFERVMLSQLLIRKCLNSNLCRQLGLLTFKITFILRINNWVSGYSVTKFIVFVIQCIASQIGNASAPPDSTHTFVVVRNMFTYKYVFSFCRRNDDDVAVYIVVVFLCDCCKVIASSNYIISKVWMVPTATSKRWVYWSAQLY
jgi:hypothetical protein